MKSLRFETFANAIIKATATNVEATPPPQPAALQTKMVDRSKPIIGRRVLERAEGATEKTQ
eukprot:scaffold44598_cov358-Skeletonema_marinoi.AAC.1